MKGTRAWFDWVVLALCMAAALGAVLYGARALDLSGAAPPGHGRPPAGAFALIAALALVNCGFLVGAAACKARAGLGSGRG